MNLVSIQVEIDHGKLTPADPELLPESGRGVLTVLSHVGRGPGATFSIETERDGLPVIRAANGVITSALVREIEGLGA